jgi:hypothetical protein
MNYANLSYSTLNFVKIDCPERSEGQIVNFVYPLQNDLQKSLLFVCGGLKRFPFSEYNRLYN